MLEALGDMPHDLRLERGATAYSDNISINVSDEEQLLSVENASKEYEAVAEAKVNVDMSVDCNSAPVRAGGCRPITSWGIE